MTHTKTGEFVWYELLTTDPEAAVAFYSAVLGWTTQSFGDDYRMWVGSQGPLGGVMKLPPEVLEAGAPPHWSSHVQVANVDATVALVRELGGAVYVEPTDTPDIGRYALIADPQGAAVNVFTPNGPMDAQDRTRPGEFGWSELLAADHREAFAFYNKLFGWEIIQEHDMGSMGTYLLFGLDGKAIGGMFTKPADMPVPVWNYYVEVANLDAATELAKTKGATVLMAPHEVPGGSRIAQLQDPQGAMFALLESKS